MANGGTLFIDEVGEMPLSMQVKLLRVLQNQRFMRVGGTAEIISRFRLVAATNRDLRDEVAKGRFREDLFYRLSVVPLRVPPLRERREDIPSLLSLCVNQLNVLLGKQVIGFTDDALALMKDFPWDGNLAQLDRVVRTLVIKANSPYIDRVSVEEVIQAEQPSGSASHNAPGYHSINLQQSLADIEYDIVRLVLQEENNNQSKAARRLNMGRSTLWNMLKKHG